MKDWLGLLFCIMGLVFVIISMALHNVVFVSVGMVCTAIGVLWPSGGKK